MARPGFRTSTGKELPEMIRRQIGTQANRRLLARMPDFALLHDTPDAFEHLLAELDAVERGVNGRGTTSEDRSGLRPPASGRGRTLK